MKEVLEEALGKISDSYIEEAAEEKAASRPRSRKAIFGIAAACFALALVAGTTVFAVSAEQKEYNKAAAFFEEKGLSTEGLTRSEVKAIYKDITTQAYALEQTAKVITNSIPGAEIRDADLTPEELDALMNHAPRLTRLPQNGVIYQIMNFGLDINMRDWKGIVSCYRGKELLWKAEILHFQVRGCTRIGEETAILGIVQDEENEKDNMEALFFVDKDGNFLWNASLDHGFPFQYWFSYFVLENAGGNYTVISSEGDESGNHFLCLTEFDKDGTELSFQKTEASYLGRILQAARLGDGYLLSAEVTTGENHIFRVNADGTVTGQFSYETENDNYRITDICEFNGQVLLSGYRYPKFGQQELRVGHEMADALLFCDQKMKDGEYVSSEMLTPLVQDTYTAVLLVCDPESGVPQTFCEVKGALGGTLAVNENGELEWLTEQIFSALFSPATNFFSIEAFCNVICQTFDTEGNLIGSKDMDEIYRFAR